MGAVMGVLSSKVVLKTGTLLIASRLAMHAVPATIDPSIPTTEISKPLAQQLKVNESTIASRRYVDIGNHTISIGRVMVVDGDAPTMVIGADVLRETALAIDLKKKQLRVLEPAEFRRAVKGSPPVEALFGPDHCPVITATAPDGKQVKVALTGSPTSSQSSLTEIKINGMPFFAGPQLSGRCPESDYSLNWSAFDGRNLVLDLRHGRMWLS